MKQAGLTLCIGQHAVWIAQPRPVMLPTPVVLSLWIG